MVDQPIHHDPETGEVIEETNPHRTSTAKLRALLAREHNTTLPDDDPMFMMVSVFNALMDDAEASFAAKSQVIVQDFKVSLAKELQPITEEALKNQIHGHMAKMRESGEIVERLMHTFKRYCFWLMICGSFTCLIALANIILIVV